MEWVLAKATHSKIIKLPKWHGLNPPFVPAVLAHGVCLLYIDRLFASFDGAVDHVPPAKEDEPEESPPPADEYPPQHAVLGFLLYFIYHVNVYYVASAFRTYHECTSYNLPMACSSIFSASFPTMSSMSA